MLYNSCWYWLVSVSLLLVAFVFPHSANAQTARPAQVGGQKSVPSKKIRWVGLGKRRLLVRVAPVKIGSRRSDELPTEIEVDIDALFAKRNEAGATPRRNGTRRVDVNSIQVVRYNPRTGEPGEYANYAYGRSPHDRPFRWYDAAIGYHFPEFHDSVDRTGGKIVRKERLRGGYFYHAVGDWKKGRLAWSHTQHGDDPAYYAVYFDERNAEPEQPPPRGWLGDGTPRCDRTGGTTAGADHYRIDLDDWNEDGLIDLIAGESYGHVFWWPNRGTKQQPRFPYCKFVLNREGLPLDAGMAAAPKVVDVNGDGVKDLLVGTEWNRVLYYQNMGTNRDRRLAYRGLLEIDGKPLALPTTPLARGNAEVFRRDYYPVLETADWDRDGDMDLLAGGYITGRIYFYENQPRTADEISNRTLRLRLGGPIEADGQPLNVGHWCAAPCAADFDGDGDLDLMSGNMPMHLTAKEKKRRAANFLQYWENTSTDKNPRLRARPFPGSGEASGMRLATPRAFDWDRDGDLDLIVSARKNIYLFKNTGTPTRPHFQLHAKPLPITWGLSTIAADQLRDWNGDGKLDLVQNYSVRLQTGAGNPYRWEKTVSVLAPGDYIAHPSHTGDDWFWPFLDDFDQDGNVDVLFGDWFGHVWFHRRLDAGKVPRFDIKGVRMQLSDGKLIQVGPIGKDPEKDFDALQGARTVLTTADFDRDGLRDLVVGDTYGKVRYYRNITTKNAPHSPRFAAPIEIGDLGIRLLVDAVDWDQDGWIDVIAGAASGKVRVFLNRLQNKQTGELQPFAEGADPGLPPILQPRVLMADINGDGDEDLFLPSTQGSCLVERSFLEHGYAQATLLAVERRP